MNLSRLNTFGDSINRAFEAFCNQLFEYWVRQKFAATVSYFTTVNGAGGDGGVEAYAVLTNGDIIGVQTKWFPNSLDASQIKQIETSINTAKRIRPRLKTYIICLPRDFQSIKIGRGNKVVGDTEENRINNLIDDIASSFPDLTLEFWNEERLRQVLQNAGNEDIERFWFERQELSKRTLTARFDLAKVGWLQERYVPSLHQYGTIHQLVNQSLYSESFRQQLATGCTQIISLLKSVLSDINAFQTLSGHTSRFYQDLSALSIYLTAQLQALTDAVQLIRIGSDAVQISIFPEYPYQSLIDRLLEARVDNVVLNAKSQLVNALESIHHQSVDESLNELHELARPHNVILLGRPGTGKTHGFAREVEARICAGYPALLIQAKEVNPLSWAHILQHALGGFSVWSDAEILAGFEALAVRVDQYRAQTNGVPSDTKPEPTRVLICIDGVDESSDVNSWRNRIDEARDLIRKYPRLRFAFSCRSFPPARPNPYNIHSNNINRLYELPRDGDYRVVELAALYLDAYNIKYDSIPWLIHLFENALSVKLFCEKHQGEDLSIKVQQITLSTASLIHAKFTQIESEFRHKLNVNWSEEDQVFIKLLQLVAELFSQQVSIDHERLCTGIVNLMNGLVTRDLASKLVSDLVNHGVLEKQEFPDSNLLKPVSINYRLTYQSYFDYFIAINAISEILQYNLKELPQSALGPYRNLNSLLTIATILLNDYNILVGEDDYWVTSLEADDLFQLKYQALATASDIILTRYIPLLCHDWQLSVTNRNFLLRTVILPNLRRPALRLGLDCIHATLIGFSSTYERDRFWSGPGRFESDTSENIGDILEGYQLSKMDRYDGPPLILAWSLSSVNNIYREKARLELTKWAVPNIDDFIKLLNLLFFCGDPQIQEDLASVMLGIVSHPDQPDSNLDGLAQWVYDNVTSPRKTGPI
jgi:hypothetical protein